MLLQIKHNGQLCNRLFSLLPTMAYAIHNKKKLFVLLQDRKYLDYFPNIYNNHWVRFLLSKDADDHTKLYRMTRWISKNPKKNIGAKIERVLLRMADKPKYAVNGDLTETKRLKGICCIDGWEHRSDLSFINEERAKLLDLFMPREDIISHVDEYFSNYDGVTVGVHIRRGDYKEHLDGRYFFDDETYLSVIQDIKNQIIKKGINNVRFLICSNEPFIMRNDVANMFQIEPLFSSDCMTDLYGLSRCDYIIGPPSTFSQWASFMGNTPLNVFFKKGDVVKLSEFSPIVSLDRFANNTGYYDRME